jgi:hypothetical protein
MAELDVVAAEDDHEVTVEEDNPKVQDFLSSNE